MQVSVKGESLTDGGHILAAPIAHHGKVSSAQLAPTSAGVDAVMTQTGSWDNKAR